MSFKTLLKSMIKSGVRPVVRALLPPPHRIIYGHWGLTQGPVGDLQLGGLSVEGMLERFGSPLHISDVQRLRQNVREFTQPSPNGKRLDLFFSYKTHPVPAILRRIHDLGVGAEVISEHELELAFHLGVPADRIIYNGPGKSDASIRLAIERGILLLNINHLEEIDRIRAIARAVGKKVRVGIRVATRGGWTMQFGLPIATGEAAEAFRRALAAPELTVVGLHSHRGGKISDEGTLRSFLAEVLAFSDFLRRAFNFCPEILDLGGSLGLPTVHPYSSRDIRLGQTFHAEVGAEDPATKLCRRDYVRIVLEVVESHYASTGAFPRIVVEPGRALTGDTQALACRVMTTRAVPGAPTFAILDAGINLASILRSEYHEVFAVARPDAARDHRYRLAGPICQPGDVIYQCVSLPTLKTGDALMIMDSGAYFEPDSTSFSFGRPATVMVESGEAIVARAREDFAHLIARDRL